MATAAVDAVRRDEAESVPPATTELEETEALAEQLARLGARGDLVLYGGSCLVQRVSLPTLGRTEDLSGCRVSGAVSPDGSAVARCNDIGVGVFVEETGNLAYTVAGCAPAWQPDGTLTVAHDGAIVRPCAAQEPCPETLIPRSELVRAAHRHPTVPERAPRLRVLVEGIAWLTQNRAAVELSIRMGGRLAGIGAVSAIAVFDGGRLASTQPYFRVTGGRLDVSPLRTYVTLTPDVILRGDGEQVSLPPHLRGVRDFAWSPDERFLALAMRFAVVVVDVASLERYNRTGGGLRSVTIPQPAARLAWR